MTEELVNTYIGRRPASEDPTEDVFPSDPILKNTTEPSTDVTKEASQSVNEFTEMNPPIYPHAYLPKEEYVGEEESEDAIRGPASFELEQLETVNSTGTLDEIPEDQLNKETQIENENKNNLFQKMMNFLIPSAEAQEIATPTTTPTTTPTPTPTPTPTAAPTPIESLDLEGNVIKFKAKDFAIDEKLLGKVKKNGKTYPRVVPTKVLEDYKKYAKKNKDFFIEDVKFRNRLMRDVKFVTGEHRNAVMGTNTSTKGFILGMLDYHNQKVISKVKNKKDYKLLIGRSVDDPTKASRSGTHGEKRGGALDVRLTNLIYNNPTLFTELTDLNYIAESKTDLKGKYGGLVLEDIFFFKEAKTKKNWRKGANKYLQNNFPNAYTQEAIVNEASYDVKDIRKVVKERVEFLKNRKENPIIISQDHQDAFIAKIEALAKEKGATRVSFPDKLPHYHLQSSTTAGQDTGKKDSEGNPIIRYPASNIFNEQNKLLNLRNTNDQ